MPGLNQELNLTCWCWRSKVLSVMLFFRHDPSQMRTDFEYRKGRAMPKSLPQTMVTAASFLPITLILLAGVELMSPARVMAQPAIEATETAPLSLDYVPRDAAAIIAIRPRELGQCRALVPLKEFVSKQVDPQQQLGPVLDRMEQIITVGFADFDRIPGNDPAFIFHMSNAGDARTLMGFLNGGAEDVEYAGQRYKKGGGSLGAFADDRIVVMAEEKVLRRLIVAGRAGASRAKWADQWKKLESGDAALLVNLGRMTVINTQWMKSIKSELSEIIASDLTALSKVSVVTLGLIADDAIELKLRVSTRDPVDLVSICTALQSGIEVHQAFLSVARAEVSKEEGKKGAGLLKLAEMWDGIVESLEPKIVGEAVEAKATIKLGDATKLVLLILAGLGNEDPPAAEPPAAEPAKESIDS